MHVADFCCVAALAILNVCCSSSQAAETEFAWQQDYARVTETGDIQWTPREFQFVADGSVRYIDYQEGSDDAESSWEAGGSSWDAGGGGGRHAVSDAESVVWALLPFVSGMGTPLGRGDRGHNAIAPAPRMTAIPASQSHRCRFRCMVYSRRTSEVPSTIVTRRSAGTPFTASTPPPMTVPFCSLAFRKARGC